MKRRKGLYQFMGYRAFKVSAKIHRVLFPVAVCNAGSREMRAIYAGLDRAYTEGVEDALAQNDRWIARTRKYIANKGGVADAF